MAHTTHNELTTENAAAAEMPTGLAYAARCNWIAKRDALVRVASAATAVLLEAENEAGVDYFDKIDRAADAARRPIYINSVREAAFACACIKRRKRAQRAA